MSESSSEKSKPKISPLTDLEQAMLQNLKSQAKKENRPILDILREEREKSLGLHSQMDVTETQSEDDILHSAEKYQNMFDRLITYVNLSPKKK